ncbi:uncharacterized protein J4E87_001341 [Alternaria ethzedia]|uniref:uncharacterized protein n=1 Tax=Alternaria ethzedia TaxID=181014 RepID=UPI0020C4D59B|nr:uncharacterized protein J4E87_001341 [Alternaria ethzedia]KAI4634171.1 hypothetical protein J4E87_001341 [Alternaria ethzedia]
MSICSNSVRALSRSRVSPSKTLLPFLYQTPTIQQWQSATRPVPRRNIHTPSRPYVSEDIPFEDDSDLPPVVDQQPPRKTTISRTERAVFQKLYRKFDNEGRQQKKKDPLVDVDEVFEEFQKNTEDIPSTEDIPRPSLDKVFDEVLRGDPRLRALRTERTRARSNKQDAAGAEVGKAQSSKKKGSSVEAAKLRELRLAEQERIDSLIRNAPTDRALWQTLEREVFAKVRDLDLDNASGSPTKLPTAKPSNNASKKSSEAKAAYKPSPPSTDARILFHNYPYHLITAVITLRTEFPSSPLPFSILPTIKKLGRSSHALGATTTLYKHLIRTAWIQQASYITINMLLKEMDDNAIDFDADLLGLLDAIIKEHNQARSGGLGKEMAMLYGMEMFADGLTKINTWRKVVAERLGLKSEEKRASSSLVRKTNKRSDDPNWKGRSGWWKKDGSTQGPGTQGEVGAQEYMPLVEGVNPGVDGSFPETASAKGGEQVVPSEDAVPASEETAAEQPKEDEPTDDKRAEVLV